MQAVSNKSSVRRSAILPFLGAVLLFLLVAEGALQWRIYTASKQGVIAILTGKTKYIEQDGLKILNPQYRFPGFRVNTLGVRSGEPGARTRPIIFLGASTVMGELARNNEDRFSEIFSIRAGLTAEHINAGVAGYRLKDQAKMLVRLRTIYPSARAIVVYPGFNNASDLCGAALRRNTPTAAQPLALPDWFLLDKKLGGALKVWPVAPAGAPSRVDLAPFLRDFEADADKLLSLAARMTDQVVVVTSARSFKRPMSNPERHRRASSIKRFVPCMNVDQLEETFDRMNAAMATKAKQMAAVVVDADAMMSGNPKYFADATHFTIEGETKMAEILLASGVLK